MRVDPTWYEVEDRAFLMIEGGNPRDIRDHVALIEKVPRIRIRPATDDNLRADHLNWASARFSGYGPRDPYSRQWCEAALKLFGYEFS